MFKVSYQKYQLPFKAPVLTSRGEMKVKNGYYLHITDGQQTGTGECSFIEGLSIDDLAKYEDTLNLVCKSKVEIHDLSAFPSIQFGWETALLDFKSGGKKILFSSAFTSGEKQIPINGLVWMGSKEFMQQQIEEKLKNGFRCIKIKVGAIDFEDEVKLLEFIRNKFPADIIEIRLDANGAFSEKDVFEKLDRLSRFQIHSIEQPIRQGQTALMKKVCSSSPIPVALDEELIDVSEGEMQKLLDEIRPRYIILKASLLGGLAVCDEWIKAASDLGINWWATSALESNIGLNAIVQWVFTKNNPLTQGLGTGSLYSKNVDSPLFISKGYLGYNPESNWGELPGAQIKKPTASYRLHNK